MWFGLELIIDKHCEHLRFESKNDFLASLKVSQYSRKVCIKSAAMEKCLRVHPSAILYIETATLTLNKHNIDQLIKAMKSKVRKLCFMKLPENFVKSPLFIAAVATY